jgi:hypothetical protein
MAPYKPATPFDSIDGALEYMTLLCEARDEARAAVEEDIVEASASNATRRIEALRIVIYKLDRLAEHLSASHRLLNDLRTLRRLLLDGQAEAEGADSSAAEDTR